MCGDLPNEGLNSTVEQLTAQALNMASNYSQQGLIDSTEHLVNATVIDIVSDSDPILSNAMM